MLVAVDGKIPCVVCNQRSIVTTLTDRVPEVPDILSAQEVDATVSQLVSLQRSSGMVPWFEGGHCDPWNHVEAAMAMAVGGRTSEAEAAYAWLRLRQLGNGAWFNYYRAEGVQDQRIDTNVCAYVAVGLWHHALSTGSTEVLVANLPMLESAIDFVLAHQRRDGAIAWSIDAGGRTESYALLTGSSSILLSLRCAVAAVEALGLTRPDWELASSRLAHCIRYHPGAFAPKREFAMDWYYPILSGAFSGQAAQQRLEDYWEEFVMEGLGVRCVSTEPWVTAAETAEFVLVLDALGRRGEALELFTTAQAHRRLDASYTTGLVYPDSVSFPADEATSYTSAAVVLAADALSRTTSASGLFAGEHLAPLVELSAGLCPQRHGA